MVKCPPSHIKRVENPWWSWLLSVGDSPRVPGLAVGFSGPSGTCQSGSLPSTSCTSPHNPFPTLRKREHKEAVFVGTGLSPQTRSVTSYKSSYSVFQLQRTFQTRDKTGAGKVKVGSWDEKRPLSAPCFSGRNWLPLRSLPFSASAATWVFVNIQKHKEQETGAVSRIQGHWRLGGQVTEASQPAEQL